MSVTSGDNKDEGLIPTRQLYSIMESRAHASTRGPKLVRVLALASGMGLIGCSVAGLWRNDARFSPLEFIASLLALATGLFSFMLECDLALESRKKLVTKVPILGKVSGRGSVYAAVGLLQCALFQSLHLIVGLFTAGVGIYMFRVGQSASESLVTLRKSITDEKALLTAFQSSDKNGDGRLEFFEFEGLMLELGVELDSDELDAAFSSIDANNDKKIVYDEFRTWWKATIVEVDIDAGAVV